MTIVDFYKKIIKLTPYKTSRKRSFCDKLREALSKYEAIVEGAVKSNTKDMRQDVLDDVRQIIKIINKIIDKSYNGKHSEAYEEFKNLLLEYKKRDELYALPKLKNERTFYRMRVFENRRVNIPSNDMFHVPLSMRREIKTQRYSIPGYPCLYMGKSVYACWEEMGRPRMSDCWVSRLDLDSNIDFFDLRVPYIVNFYMEVPRIVRLFPLIIASMMPVDEVESIYKPEYIIPQLMMEWVISTRAVQGILYTSVMAGDDFDYLLNKKDNVAIPVVQPSSLTKYCPDLVRMFKITEPINVEIEKLKYPKEVGYDYVGDISEDDLEHREKATMQEEFDLVDKEVDKWRIREKNYMHSDFFYLEQRLNEYPLKEILT